MDPRQKKYIRDNTGKSVSDLARDLGLAERQVRRFLEREKASSAAAPGLSVSGRAHAASIILMMVLGVAVYGNTLAGEFLWDDQYLVVENTYLRNTSFTKNIFTENILGGTKRLTAFYRPLQVLTYRIDYVFWKLNPRGYHLSNVLTHVAAAVCLYLFLFTLFGRPLLALIASLLFTAHPVHTEAVSYISGRADPLVFIFIMLSMVFYLRRLRSSRAADYVLLVLSVSAALLSKEIALILPLLMLLVHGVFGEKIRWRDFASVLVLAVLYAAVRSTVLKSHIGDMALETTWMQRLPGFFAALAGYARLMVWPFGLHMEYGNALFSFRDPSVWGGLAVGAGLIAGTLVARRRDRVVFFSLLWFAACLLPVSNIFPLVTYMSEHWLYLPSVGFFLIVAKLLGFSSAKKPHPAAVIAVGILVVFYAALTVRQNRLWNRPVALYESMLRAAPESVRLLNNLANIYAKEGRDREAEALYERAVASHPDSAVSYYNFANFYKAKKEIPRAIAMYRRAIELNPGYVEAYNNLGTVYQEGGQLAEAAALYEKGAALGYFFPAIHENLANLYERLGRGPDAIAAYEKIVAFNPLRKDIYNNLAVAYAGAGRMEEAIFCLKKALALDPRYAVATKNLAVFYYRTGAFDAAVATADKAIAQGARMPEDFLAALQPYRKN